MGEKIHKRGLNYFRHIVDHPLSFLLNIMLTLLPPKAKELLIKENFPFIGEALSAMHEKRIGDKSGSFSPSQICGGKESFLHLPVTKKAKEKRPLLRRKLPEYGLSVL